MMDLLQNGQKVQKIMLCKLLYMEDAYTKIIMLCENHVMRGLGITTTIELLM